MMPHSDAVSAKSHAPSRSMHYIDPFGTRLQCALAKSLRLARRDVLARENTAQQDEFTLRLNALVRSGGAGRKMVPPERASG